MKTKWAVTALIITTIFATSVFAQSDINSPPAKKKTTSAKKKSPSNKKKSSKPKKPAAPAAMAAPLVASPEQATDSFTPIEPMPKGPTPPLKKEAPPPKRAVAKPIKKISNEAIKNANNAIGIQLIKTNVNYAETDLDGSLSNTENGYVPGFSLNFSVMKNLLLGNDYIAASYSKNSGNTNYIGALLIGGGGYGSIRQVHQASLKDYSIRYGKGFEVSDRMMLTPFIELGAHQWNRNLGSYQEAYTNKYYAGGLLGQISPSQNWVVSASGVYGKTTSSNISLSGSMAQLFPGASLGNSDIYKFGLAVDYAFTRSFHGNLSSSYSSFKYGRSAVINGFLEPDSATKYTTFGVGASYNF